MKLEREGTNQLCQQPLWRQRLNCRVQDDDDDDVFGLDRERELRCLGREHELHHPVVSGIFVR